jgi:hypothetical protein
MKSLTNPMRSKGMRTVCVAILKQACLLALGAPAGAVDRPSWQGPESSEEERRIISLNGIWDVEPSENVSTPPATFTRKVPVPGLVDLATPHLASDSVIKQGEKTLTIDGARKMFESKTPIAFWYHTTFHLPCKSPIALLRIRKAMYARQVWINGQSLPVHHYNQSVSWHDLAPHLREPGAKNQLIIRVGTSNMTPPDHIMDGDQREKQCHQPGVFDDVDLICTGNPYISLVRIAPSVRGNSVRVAVDLENRSATPASAALKAEIREAGSGKVVAANCFGDGLLAGMATKSLEQTILIPECRTWSPDAPDLYELHLSSANDSYRERFGMRELVLDKADGRLKLNGKTVFLLGSSIPIYRFFDDPLRGLLPWNEKWVRKMYQIFKRDCHWNCIRFHIGPAPEMWYRIADEEGVMIADEAPVWTDWGCGHNKTFTDENLAEYLRASLRERGNHASIVLLDAQNESASERIARVATPVFAADLQTRLADPITIREHHPYIRFKGRPDKRKHVDHLCCSGSEPRKDTSGTLNIVNEYCWAWLDRDGTPTLGRETYKPYFGGELPSPTHYRWAYAMLLSAETEYHRARRWNGVMEFSSLSSSPGVTGDHWVDVENLVLDPYFKEYVADAFSPVMAFIEGFAEDQTAGASTDACMVAINDLPAGWQGTASVSIWKGKETVWQGAAKELAVEAYGRTVFRNSTSIPELPGSYVLRCELRGSGKYRSRSHRMFWVEQANHVPEPIGLDVPVTRSTCRTGRRCL